MVLGERSSEQKFSELKENFFKTNKENIGLGKYHSLDLERLRKDNEWLKAFYKYANEDPVKTVSMVHDVLLWRNDFGTNDLIVSGKPPVSEDLFKKGAMFYKNEDINCIPMLHFVVKTHKKNNFSPALVQRFIAYFFETKYKFNLDDPIILVMDMSDTGYSNLMPFIFNAAWKIIKNWLPPSAVNLIKFCDKKSIKEFIQDSQLFTHMGGTDNYKYSFNPDMFLIKNPSEKLNISPKQDTENAIKITEIQLKETSQYDSSALNSPTKSKATPTILMADAQDLPIQNTEQELQSPSKSISNGVINKIFDASVSTDQESSQNVLRTPLLTISPGDELLFDVATDARQDITGFIKLINNSEGCIAFKIKITSPDKFRVKPGAGIIPVAGNASIMINFLKEFHNSVSNHRDKFLILWATIDENKQVSDLNEFWKQITAKKQYVNEHKVKCNIRHSSKELIESPSSFSLATSVDKSLKISPSSLSVNSNLSLKNKETPAAGNTVRQRAVKKKVNDSELSQDSNSAQQKVVAEAHEPVKPKIERLEVKKLVPTSDHSLLMQVEPVNKNDTNMRLYRIEKNIDLIINNQNKIENQNALLANLIYFLILLSFLQMMFQSSLYSSVSDMFPDSSSTSEK